MTSAPSSPAGTPPGPPRQEQERLDERFDELLVRLRGLVEKLEGGHLPLEDGLRCFEEGMTLCRRGAEILDRAERRVEVLLGSNAEGARTAPFDTTDARQKPRQWDDNG